MVKEEQIKRIIDLFVKQPLLDDIPKYVKDKLHYSPDNSEYTDPVNLLKSY